MAALRGVVCLFAFLDLTGLIGLQLAMLGINPLTAYCLARLREPRARCLGGAD